ncbi:multiple epidermal growth factor-like domains protein 10, partial [Gigantopelta aegis]|uniref:multiple epidermal growth factor-like domains protein 10 n=1 Tax=Gigantopelta aegis TaxID=1735272 RepID=UPI001B88A0DA
NVAGGKTAYQSSYYSGYSETSANKGCDGDNTQQTCILTNTNQPFTWWEVDLQKYYYVSQVWIYFRTDYAVRRNGIHVYTSNSSRQGNAGYDCGQVTGQPDGSDINDVTRITCNNVARYVTVYQATNNGNATAMDFCEVEVYACELGVKYGSTCDKVCNSRHCAVQSSSCNVQTGDCGTGRCQQGWTGVDCTTACKLGDNYGANCNRNCRYRHCVSQAAPCTTDTGDCGNEGCEPGWTGVDCTQPCSRGTYGSACSRQCSARHCEGVSTCDHITGGCVGG